MYQDKNKKNTQTTRASQNVQEAKSSAMLEHCATLTCQHAFSTRLGGVSNPPYSSLNLGYYSGDSKEKIVENWHIFSNAAQISTKYLVCAHQVHKPHVAVVNKSDAHTPETMKHIEDCDGLITTDPDVTLAIFTADCGALLFHDPQTGIIAALHCGWKPFVADIIGNAMLKMKSLEAQPQNIEAGIGPMINKCCFETGVEVKEAFYNLLGTEAQNLATLTDAQNNKHHLDLRGGIVLRLQQLGVQPENISHVDECTKCMNDKYFSYRAENGLTGRLAHIIHL